LNLEPETWSLDHAKSIEKNIFIRCGKSVYLLKINKMIAKHKRKGCII